MVLSRCFLGVSVFFLLVAAIPAFSQNNPDEQSAFPTPENKCKENLEKSLSEYAAEFAKQVYDENFNGDLLERFKLYVLSSDKLLNFDLNKIQVLAETIRKKYLIAVAFFDDKSEPEEWIISCDDPEKYPNAFSDLKKEFEFKFLSPQPDGNLDFGWRVIVQTSFETARAIKRMFHFLHVQKDFEITKQTTNYAIFIVNDVDNEMKAAFEKLGLEIANVVGSGFQRVLAAKGPANLIDKIKAVPGVVQAMMGEEFLKDPAAAVSQEGVGQYNDSKAAYSPGEIRKVQAERVQTARQDLSKHLESEKRLKDIEFIANTDQKIVIGTTRPDLSKYLDSTVYPFYQGVKVEIFYFPAQKKL